MSNVEIQITDISRRTTLVAILTETESMNGYVLYLVEGCFPSIVIYRKDEKRIGKREENAIRKLCKMHYPDHIIG